MPRLYYDPFTQTYIPEAPRGLARNATSINNMLGHDSLPPEWRVISRMVRGNIVAYKYRQGWPLLKVVKYISRRFKETST